MSEKRNPLSPREAQVILHKGTEMPFSGEYDDFFEGVRRTCTDHLEQHVKDPALREKLRPELRGLPGDGKGLQACAFEFGFGVAQGFELLHAMPALAAVEENQGGVFSCKSLIGEGVAVEQRH